MKPSLPFSLVLLGPLALCFSSPAAAEPGWSSHVRRRVPVPEAVSGQGSVLVSYRLPYPARWTVKEAATGVMVRAPGGALRFTVMIADDGSAAPGLLTGPTGLRRWVEQINPGMTFVRRHAPKPADAALDIVELRGSRGGVRMILLVALRRWAGVHAVLVGTCRESEASSVLPLLLRMATQFTFF